MMANKAVHMDNWGANPVIKRYLCCINVLENPHATFFRVLSHFNRCGLKCWDTCNTRDQSTQHSITVLGAERLNIGYHRRLYLTLT